MNSVWLLQVFTLTSAKNEVKAQPHARQLGDVAFLGSQDQCFTNSDRSSSRSGGVSFAFSNLSWPSACSADMIPATRILNSSALLALRSASSSVINPDWNRWKSDW